MKVVLGIALRTAIKSTLGLIVVGGLLTGCSDDSTSPEAVDLTELKYPFGLSIQDQGGGKILLSWSGMNNEEDFSGYNVYGVKANDDITAKAGDTIQLLTSDGEQSTEGKTELQKMSYNGTDWETVGEIDPDLDAEFQIVPYHTATDADGNAILPTCRPSGTGEACAPLSEDDSLPGDYSFNGETSIELTGLKMAATYCFTVASTLDNGSKISSTTSEVRCVVPRAEVTLSATADKSGTGGNTSYLMNFTELRESCDGAGTCDGSKLGISTENTATTTSLINNPGLGMTTTTTLLACTASTSVTACLENYSSKPNFTAGADGAIQDLGYYPDGFSDPSFVRASKLEWSEDQLIHGGGYSLAGQSLPLENDHIYVIAESKEAGDNSEFYYHYVFVDNMGAQSDSVDLNLTIRVAEKLSDR